jgi:hypothetical protein
MPEVSLLAVADIPAWELVCIPIIGLAAAGLVAVVARTVFTRRPPPKPPNVENKQTQPAFGQSDPFIHGSARETRAGFRRSGNPIQVAITDAEAEKELGNGWVIDRSAGGMGLAVFEPMDTGTIISVRPSKGAELAPWVQLEIMSCRRATDSWELGCRFVRTPPWSVLLLFG